MPEPPRPPAVPLADPATVGDGASVALPAPPREPQPGDMVGPYRIVRTLGRGGMAVVYEADDTELPRHVALKVLVDAASDPQGKVRFMREAYAQAKITHDNVVPIYRVGEFEGLSYIAMPVLNGQSLAQALSTTPKPPLPAVVRIAAEIAEGLSAAHAAGLIHRDIKPANIWLEAPKWRVKILDFGLVRDPHANTQIDITMQGHVVGTPAYMSPEQAGGRDVDHRTDLWSLGVVLYQMTTGVRPFNDDNTVNLMTAIVSNDVPEPVHLAPNLPSQLSDLIRRLMSKNPAKRPASAAQVAVELEAVGASLTAPAVALTALPSVVPDVSQPMEPNPWNDLDATETDRSRAVPMPIEDSTESGYSGDSYDRPAALPPRTRPKRGRTEVPKWAWVAGGAVVGVLLIGLLAWAIFPGGSKPTVATHPTEQPRPTPKKADPPKSESELNREAAEALNQFATLALIPEGEQKATEYAAGKPLPTGKFTVVGIYFESNKERDKALKEPFVSGTLLPAIAPLKSLQVILANLWHVELTADHLRQMATMPLAQTLRSLEVSVELTPASVLHLKKFDALESVVFVPHEPSDDLFAQLAQLPKLKYLTFYRLGLNETKLTHKGWDAVAALPLDVFTLGWSRGAPNALKALAARRRPFPALRFMACHDLSDQVLREYLRPETDVKALTFFRGELTNACLPTLMAATALKELVLTETKIDYHIKNAARDRPDLRIIHNGEVINGRPKKN